MSLDIARQNVTTAIEAARLSYVTPPPIEYDNKQTIDTKVQSDPFIMANMKVMDGYQADLSPNPIHRIVGQIHLAVVVKEGSGSSQALVLLDHMYKALQGKKHGIVRTKYTTFAPVKTQKGLTYYPILIPFWFDEIS